MNPQSGSVTVSPNAAAFQKVTNRTARIRIVLRLSMESIQRPSPQSINRPHPSPHLCRMIGVRVHTSCCDRMLPGMPCVLRGPHASQARWLHGLEV
jgi:hypothetical protein